MAAAGALASRISGEPRRGQQVDGVADHCLFASTAATVGAHHAFASGGAPRLASNTAVNCSSTAAARAGPGSGTTLSSTSSETLGQATAAASGPQSAGAPVSVVGLAC